jgi:radical SAM superfamily enzyme YgiQ (UPF0313 family)
VERAGEMYDFPVGLAYISAVLKASGREVRTLNLNHYHDNQVADVIRDVIRNEDIDVVGTGGLSPHYHNVREVIRAVRAAGRELPIILGGGILTSEPELMLEALGVEVGVIGEGENTMLELAQAFESGADLAGVKGIVYRDAAGRVLRTEPRPAIMDLDALPHPDYAGFEVEDYLARQRTNDNIYVNALDHPRLLPVISSRSCPFNCTFCFHPLGNKYRKRSMDSFFAEVDSLVSRYDINMLAVLDELFSFHTDQLEAFCARMKPYNLLWIAQLRVDHVDAKVLSMLKDAGLFFISYGLESASETVLKSMKKHISVPQIEKALAITDEIGVGIQGNFIFGDPAETLATARETIAWWKEHTRYNINFTALIPYPGCEDYKFCLEKGFVSDRLAFIEAGCPSINMTALSPKDYGQIFQEATQAQFEMRQSGEVLGVEKKGYDTRKKTMLYRLSVRCPHCGEVSVYDDFHKRELEVFKVCCRNCRRRFALSSTIFEHIRTGFGAVISRLARLRDEKTPVSLTPVANAHDFKSRLALLGFAPEDFNLRYALDYDATKAGTTFLDSVPVLHRTPENVAAHCADHVFLILPCERPAAVLHHLVHDCGVHTDRILSLGHRNCQPGAMPLGREEIAAALAQVDPELAALTPLSDWTSVLVNSGVESAMYKAMERLREKGVKRAGLATPSRFLTSLLKAAAATGKFADIQYVDEERTNPVYAFEYGVRTPIPCAAVDAYGLEAVVAVRGEGETVTDRELDARRAGLKAEIVDFRPEKESFEHICQIAADIAQRINRLQPDVLYVADFSYNNFTKQSLALRRRGLRTVILLQNPRSMDFKEGCFDGIFSTYMSHVALFNVLAAVDVPVIHMQGWLTKHYLAPLARAANPRAKLVVEFNDIGSLVGDGPALRAIFGEPTARLDEISEALVHRQADALIYNCSADAAQEVRALHGHTGPALVLHSYPERSFALPEDEVLAAAPANDAPHLVFIGSLAPSSLPAEAFGDVQLLPLIKNTLRQRVPFDVFLAPYADKGAAAYADYAFLEGADPLFTLRNAVSPLGLARQLAGYSFGVMFYRLKPDLLIGKKHFRGMLPTKFFSFIEAGLPVAVSEELEFVARIVAENGLGVVLSQRDLDDLPNVLARADQRTLRKNILAYRETCWMDGKIEELSALYMKLMD